MLRRPILFAAISLATFALASMPAFTQATKDDEGWTRKNKVPPPSAHIEVTVLRATNGKPIENAAVIFHPLQGEKDKGILELKTNEDGKAIIEVIPIGDTVRLQVIANGFQTYGEDYKIDKPEITMEVKMKRPAPQYSTYGSGATAKPDSGSASGKQSGSSTPPASGNSATPNNSSQQTPPPSQPK